MRGSVRPPAPIAFSCTEIEVHGRHGVFEFERQNGQRFVIDIDWWIDTGRAVHFDRLETTLCYKALYDLVVKVVSGEPWQLIEKLGAVLIDTLFEEFAAIQKLHVTVHGVWQRGSREVAQTHLASSTF